MSKHDPIADMPNPDVVRAALERIVMSDVFRASPQLAAFLNFVVEAVLQGKSDRIKGYTIGVEVLRRDVKFDPQLDPIVRVEATRLRRALERYYNGPGLDDTVIIDMPRGSYVPTFRRRSDIIEDPEIADAAKLALRRNTWLVAGVLLLVASTLTWVMLATRSHAPILAASLPTSSETLRPGNGMPTLMVQNFEIVGTPDTRSVSATALTEKLRDSFSRFDAINIATEDVRTGPAIDYRLRGFIDYLDDGTTNVSFNLLDIGDGNAVWTRSFPRIRVAGDRSALEDSIVGDVATTLLQPFGIIRSRERSKMLANGASDPRYRCLLVTSDAFRSFDPAEHGVAQSCLEHLIAVDPGFGDGFSYLASLENREYVYGFGIGADDPNTLDQALQLARRGIEINPSSARSWQVLSTVLFSRHDTVAAFDALQKALTLNPYDLIIVGELGGRLITTGEIDRGMMMLQRAATEGNVRPSWHHFYLFLGNYMRGKLQEATYEADEMTSETYSHGLFARALTAALNGDGDKARALWAKLVVLRGAWRDHPRSELDKYIFADAILDRLMGDITRNGLAKAE